MSLRVDPFGPHALLARFAVEGDAAAFDHTQALLHHLEQRPPRGLIELTPGFTTLLLEFEPGTRPEPQSLAIVLEQALGIPHAVPLSRRSVDIPVVYDGPDLERVARHANLTVEEVVRHHTAASYRVQILGFAPGFPYLMGLDPRLWIPRLDTPRAQVPAGSVAIGGEHTGIYPVATAGGWNLIGRTDTRLVDPTRAAAEDVEAFLLQPGDTVRFVAIKGFPTVGLVRGSSSTETSGMNAGTAGTEARSGP